MARSLSDIRRRTGRRALLRPVELLEDRLCPVIGAYDIPGPIEAGDGYDGVARINVATGALLSTGRHLLTAAHVAAAGSKASSNFVVAWPGGPVEISTPGAGFVRHPIYPFGSPDNFDIGVMPLAELAPLTAERWDLYTDTDEDGQVGRMVGYGGTGTGTIGHSTDVNPNEYWATSTGTDKNYEVVRLTITGNPTGGFFFPRLSGQIPPVQPAVAFNTVAAALAGALDALPGISQTLVRLVGDTDFDGTVDHFGNPHAGSFEILFRGTTDPFHSMPDLTVTDNFTGGVNPGVVVETLLQGGSNRIKTGGFNLVGLPSADGFRLYTDFDDGTALSNTLEDGLGQGANEGHGTWGDSGSPLFIDGKIAGVLEGLYGTIDEIGEDNDFVSDGGYDGFGGSGDFGEFDSWARVSTHQAFINDLLDDPFDLVLDMENQPWGNDNIDETEIAVSRFGSQFRININGVLRYACPMDQVLSVTIRGSADNETIQVSGLGEAIPITISGRGGADTIRLTGLASGGTATLNGNSGADTFIIGDGDFDSNIRGTINIVGNSGADTLLIDDTSDANGEPGPLPVPVDLYFLTATTFSKPSFFGAMVTFGGVESVRLDANSDTNVINVSGVANGVELDVFANGGNDGFVVGNGDVADNIRGDLLVHGGFNTDTLVIDDAENNDLNDVNHLGPNTFTKSGFTGSLTYQFMQVVRLDAGPFQNIVHVDGTSEDVTSLLINTFGGNDTVYVHAVNAATAVSIDTGSGQDIVEVGDGDLDTIDGPLAIEGGPGTDSLNVHDHADAGNDGYTLTSNSVTKTGFFLTYDDISVLTLDANPGNNIIDIESTSAGTAVTVQAGAGNDTIALAPTLQNLTNLHGAVTVNGQGGADTVVLHDESFALGGVLAYAVTGTTVGRFLFGGLTYGTVEDLQLRLGSGDDTVNITGLAPGTLTQLFGNAGDDTFNFFAPAPAAATGGHLFILGGSPTDVKDGDTLNVYWQQPKPKIKKHKTGGDHDAGYVSVDYGGGLEYLIDYDDIELVNVEKL